MPIGRALLDCGFVVSVVRIEDGWLTWVYTCEDGSVDHGVSQPDTWHQI